MVQLTAYTVEILPFKIRAKGLMIMNFFVNIALIFNQWVNPIALNRREFLKNVHPRLV